MIHFIDVKIAGESYLINTSIIEMVYLTKDGKPFIQLSTTNSTGRTGMTLDNDLKDVRNQILLSRQGQGG